MYFFVWNAKFFRFTFDGTDFIILFTVDFLQMSQILSFTFSDSIDVFIDKF